MSTRAPVLGKVARLRRWTVLAVVTMSPVAHQAPAFAQAVDPHAGHSMVGMTMAGMTPPRPTPPPLGPVVALNAESQGAPIGVRGSPGQITLAFRAPVVITSFILTNAVGQQIPNRMTLPADPVQSVRIPVVIPLQPGAYTVAWRASGQGAAMNGSGSFKVQLADGSDPPPAMHHHH